MCGRGWMCVTTSCQVSTISRASRAAEARCRQAPLLQLGGLQLNMLCQSQQPVCVHLPSKQAGRVYNPQQQLGISSIAPILCSRACKHGAHQLFVLSCG